MRVLPFVRLLDWILRELEMSDSIFGIDRPLFYRPQSDDQFGFEWNGHHLATPIGPAAGPHTQLAQNIVCAWLSGGRFIELKTVQVMDELEIPRPCIDMEDEGYNVEWSQELKLQQSADEYVKAWVLVHVLRRLLGLEDQPFGTVFNMSVGYDLEGIQSPPMVRFMDRMQDASEAISEIKGVLGKQFPQFADLEISARMVDNVTLSTMHGCPPDEIERIARHLIEDRGLHTTVKLNPTLLGKDGVLHTLHEVLGYTEIQIPDAVFEHDLSYDRAVALIRSLQKTASEQDVSFAVKLSNTLAMSNHRGVLPGDEMYMSGRALYPITIQLYEKLSQTIDPLNVSYSAGADALNLATILSCGARPVTVASDLLKPGGYSRLLQYLENLSGEMKVRGVSSLSDLAANRSENLSRAVSEALEDVRYKKRYHPYGPPKVASGLDKFDCVVAPCVEQCAVCQDVPEYAWWIAQGQYDRALETILVRNPLPGVTGYVCTHLCQTRCTRNEYDEPVAIRALKRFATERGTGAFAKEAARPSGRRVAVIGSGPSGLSAACYLALSGVQVTVLEAKDRPGGMLAIAPGFRLPAEVVQADIERIAALGVEIVLNHPVSGSPQDLLAEGYDAVYVACGFPGDARLKIEGIEGEGVYSALDLLDCVAHDRPPRLGERVLIIGGGNTAMDAARTAQRLTGQPATVVYRRTRAEMPAEEEEVEDLLLEGNSLLELATPRRIVLENGRVAGLECVRNELAEPGADGRRRPVPVPGSEFVIEADSVVVAIGQSPDKVFVDGAGFAVQPNGAIAVDEQTGVTNVECVYAGGDATRGPAIIVQACADGRRAAEGICSQLRVAFRAPGLVRPTLSKEDLAQVKKTRVRRSAQRRAKASPPVERSGFDLVEQTLTEEQARTEAARCLQCSTVCEKCVEVCPNRANLAYQVTPVRLSVPVLACRDGALLVVADEPFVVRQGRQIVHIDDFCNECGNCATFCVHQGKPYEDKPRLFLCLSDFSAATDNAFYFEGGTLWRREADQPCSLRIEDDGWVYEDSYVHVRLSPEWAVREMRLEEAFEGTHSLLCAAEMSVLLQGMVSSLPFLWV